MMAAIRKWYVIVRIGASTTITFTQATDSLEGALQLSRAEMRQRFSLNDGYEFIEAGVKEGE